MLNTRLQYDDKPISYQVRNGRGDALGLIKEFLIDVKDGRVTYAILDLDRRFRLKERLLAIPWHSLQVNHQQGYFILKEKMSEIIGLG